MKVKLVLVVSFLAIVLGLVIAWTIISRQVRLAHKTSVLKSAFRDLVDARAYRICKPSAIELPVSPSDFHSLPNPEYFAEYVNNLPYERVQFVVIEDASDTIAIIYVEKPIKVLYVMTAPEK